MPIASMTGFARADGQNGHMRWHFEARAVNGKSLEIRLRLPAGFEALEGELRERASRQVRRGNVQVSLQIREESAVAAVRVNQAVLKELVAIATGLQHQLGAPAPTVEGLLALPGVIELSEPEREETEAQTRNAMLLQSADQLFQSLRQMQIGEGARLAEILANQLDQIDSLVVAARDSPARSVAAIRARLVELVGRLLETGANLDPDRLHQEVAILGSRADIQEEIDRLKAHVEAARLLLQSSEPVGRRLDFLAQEFNREANTLCSKAADTGLIRIGLDLKAVIDQFREQVQNVQ